MTLTDVSTTSERKPSSESRVKMTSAQVVETSVNVISNSPSQDYTHPDDRTLLYDMTPGFKPFTIYLCLIRYVLSCVCLLCVPT